MLAIFIGKMILWLAWVAVWAMRSWTTVQEESGRGQVHQRVALKPTTIGVGVATSLMLLVLFQGVGAVSAGYRGVVLRFGAVTGRVLPEGIYLITPGTLGWPYAAIHGRRQRTKQPALSSSATELEE